MKRKGDSNNHNLGVCAESKLPIQFRAVNIKIGDGINEQNREQD